MDAFYASVEQRDNPALRGKPVVVGGGGGGRGVVQAASYEARRFGVRSAMGGRRAKELCPDAVFVRSRMDHYVAVGRQVREIFHRFTPVVQPLSVDEAFLDVGGTVQLFGDAADIGRQIKSAIRKELDLTASVGVAPIKFVAKIASDLNKPDGFVEVPPGAVLDFLDPLPVARLWGVGAVGQKKLHRAGLRTMRDIRTQRIETLTALFGSWGEHLHRLASGIDPRRVVTDRWAKQISHERTFHEDVSDIDMLTAVVSFLSQQVAWRLRRNDRTARSVHLKYRREDFRTFARSKTLADDTDSTDVIFETAMLLFNDMRNREPRPVRLIGVSVGHLGIPGAAKQMNLFDVRENETQHREIDAVMDRLTDAVGKTAVYRGTSHRWIDAKRKRDAARDEAYEPPPEDL